MKIEQLLVQYLYDSKKLTLQGIGIFNMAADFVMPSDTDKDFVIPDNAISFEYNPKVEEDNDLILYIVKQTRKILPLASADLDSYIMLGKQFLNIGKPFRIEGIGTLQKNMAGKYDFAPGVFVTPKLSDIPRQLKEKQEHDISFDTTAREDNSSGNKKKLLLLIAALIVLGSIGFASWYFLIRKKASPETSATVEQSTPIIPAKKDSITVKDTVVKDATNIKVPVVDTTSTKPLPVADNGAGATFKVVFRTYNNEIAAKKRFDELSSWGYHLSMYKKDSSYKIAMPFARPLADTVKMKDSVRMLFGEKPYVEY